MSSDKLKLAELVTALATQPRLPGLTPLNRGRAHRTANVIEALLEKARANSNLPQH